MTIDEKIDQYAEDFALFETPNEKFEYLFDLGKKHTSLSDEDKNDDTFIEGCSSPAWLKAAHKDGIVYLQGEGTSEMAKGMLVMLLDIFDGQKAEDILAFDSSHLERLGIVELMSPVRQQSLEAFMKKLKTIS